MADLSLDDIIATKQGVNVKKRPFNQNVRKQFQGKPVQHRIQQKPFKPGFAPKANRLGSTPLKRAFSAPGPKTKTTAGPMKPRGAQTPNSGMGLGGPGKGQIDARDMITIKNRIKIGDARLKIVQKRMNQGNMGAQPQRPQMPPPGGSGPQGPGPRGPPPQPFVPQQQGGFQPPPRPLMPPGPQGFQPPRQPGAPFQPPRPVLEQQGPRMNQPRPPQQGPQFGQQPRPFNPQQRPPFQHQKPFNQQQRPPFNPQQKPPFKQQQRPPLNQQQGPPFGQQQGPPFNQQQGPPFNQQQGPPFEQGPPFDQQQGPPFDQQQGPPFDQQQGPPFDQQQGPPFNQQPPHFNQNPQQFDQQSPEFIQQPPDFSQQPPDFMQGQCIPQFGQEQGPPFGGPEQIEQFNPDPQFDPQFDPQGPPEQLQQFGQQGPPGAPPVNQLPQMNQPPPNLMQMPPGPGHPPGFNQPPPNQGFNPPPNLSQPPPDFIQPASDMSQPPPGFGQLPPDFSGPHPGFHPAGVEEDGEEVGLMVNPMHPVEKTVVENTGNSLRITRTIPEVSFDGENLTVTRRVPAGSQVHQEMQNPFIGGGGAQTFKFSATAASKPPPPQPPKKKFQPVPIKAPSPPRNTVKTGGPTLSKARVSSTGQDPIRTNPPIQSLVPKPAPGRPVPSSSVDAVASSSSLRTAKMETAAAYSVTRTLNNAPQQPSRLKPPPQVSTSAPPQERPSALSRIQMPNRNAGSAFSRIDQQPLNTKISLSRIQQQVQGASALSRLSAPSSVPVTKRLAPPPAALPQPARVPQVSAGTRVPQVSVGTRVSQVSSGARIAVKRPAMSLSERFSPGSSGNPIPVITDHAPVKRRRPSEPEVEKAEYGAEFASTVEFPSQEEPGVPLLSPLQGYRLLVSNLHSTVTQDDIIELFGAMGPLKRANLLTKGQAEVAFIHKEHAVSALKTYHNRELDGQPMFVKLTTPLNAKVMQPPADEASPGVSLPATLRTKKPPAPSSAPVEIPLIHKALFKTSTDGAAPAKAVRFTVKL